MSLEPRQQGLAATICLFSRDGLVLFSDAWAFHDTECKRDANDFSHPGARSTTLCRLVITVSCTSDRDRWRCEVRIGDDSDATRHQVTVSDEDLVKLAPAGTSVEWVVEASFVFLLEREPRGSILPAFDLAVIARYFPEYEREIRRRLRVASRDSAETYERGSS